MFLYSLAQAIKETQEALFPRDNLCGTFLQKTTSDSAWYQFAVSLCTGEGGRSDYCRFVPGKAWFPSPLLLRPCSTQEYPFPGTPLPSTLPPASSSHWGIVKHKGKLQNWRTTFRCFCPDVSTDICVVNRSILFELPLQDANA